MIYIIIELCYSYTEGLVVKKKQIISTVMFILAALCLVGAIFIFLRLYPLKEKDTPTPENDLDYVSVEPLAPENIPERTISSEIENEEDVQDFKEETSDSEESEKSDEEVLTTSEEEPEPEEPVLLENPYKDKFLANSDMAGWLLIPDTIVDYPVMWTPENEDYYLRKDFDKKKDPDGSLILDTDSCMDPLTTNLIIHGHNMKYNSGNTMFGDLNLYSEKAYRDEHPYIYLYGKDRKHVYEVMAVFKSQVFYVSDNCFKYYNFFEAHNEFEFEDFYSNVKKLALYDTGVTAEYQDRFITLSTCAYHVDNGRFVVVAKELESEEYYEPFE